VKILAGQGKIRESKTVKQIVALLSEPLHKYGDVVTVLQLGNYSRVMATLEFETNKVMAVLVIQSILKNGTRISEVATVDALFQLLQELIRDGEDAPPVDQVSYKPSAWNLNGAVFPFFHFQKVAVKLILVAEAQ
jgi:vacuolar protein sorting-associated protein 35